MSYTLTIQNFRNNTIEFLEFTNIANALQVLHERCEALGYEITPDNNGNFLAGGIGEEWHIELTTNS